MKKYLWTLLLFIPLKPAHAITFGTPNAYMVENTTGTNGCYDFQTTPSCSANIVGLNISTETISNLMVSTITGTGTSPRLLISPQTAGDQVKFVQFVSAPPALTQIMTIDSSNLRVGIRTASPSKTLDVAGDVNIGGNLTSGDIIFNDASVQTTAAFQSVLVSGATSYPQFLYVGSSGTVLGNFQANGNVVLSSAGDTVSISSNTIMAGTTAYFGGVLQTSTVKPTTGIVGLTSGSASPAGDFGEYVSSTTTANTNTTGTTQYTNIAQVTVSAGNWCFSGTLTAGAGTATPTRFMGAISINSGNTVTDQVDGYNQVESLPPTATANTSASIPLYQILASGSTTVYLKCAQTYAAGQPACHGTLRAMRCG